jgi:arginyl-tRNA--protein-N-Asp/Glu arginylyltransferase
MKPFTPTPLTYFYLSRPAPCPYLPGREEQMVFTDLASADDPVALHDQLSRAGFRRSQAIAYKPNCRGCGACVPVRVPVLGFRATRSQRRLARRNQGVEGRELPAAALSEHFQLFRRYIRSRHGDGGMAGMSFDDYRAMVQESPVSTRLIEFRDRAGALYGVCLTDALDDGLSLVYSFFEPERADDSPGSFIIMWHIEQALKRGLPFVYLGYWIDGSRKMAYKANFRPVEALGPEGWRALP